MNVKLVVMLGMCGAAMVAAAKPTFKEQLKAQSEQMLVSMLPTNAVHEAMGFFGPVTKKYMPEFQKFNDEYLASTNKMAVVEKYLPKAQCAYNDACAMKVPAKYEAKKQEYLKLFSRFLTAAQMAVTFAQ